MKIDDDLIGLLKLVGFLVASAFVGLVFVLVANDSWRFDVYSVLFGAIAGFLLTWSVVGIAWAIWTLIRK